MSSEIESPFRNFCRTCMTQDNEADTEFQSIFDTIPNTDKRISELLSILIECYTFKGLPNRMCGKCVQRIGDVHEFQQMCLRSQLQFLQMTEDKEYSGEIVVPSDLIVDATLKESDPLRDAECMLEVKIEEYGRDQGQHVSRFETSSVNNEAEVTWKNTEEGCEARTCDYDESFHQSGTETVHACDICGKQYMILSDLKKHEKCHARKAAKKTADCKGEENAATPLKINEGGKSKTKKSHKCEYCHKAFYQIGTLRDHIRTHTGEQPFLCSECGKAFNSSSNMKQHLLRHAGVKRYECPSCPKKFPCLSDLASHKAVHSKVKPHICDICGASFGKPYQLRTHKMYHNGEKPHKCEYCEMRFVMADHMRRHMRTHTGEKPYKCKYCDRAFAQSNDLIKHLRSHLGENVYRCELCPKGFRLAAELRAHFSQHKNDDESETEKNLKELADYERNLNVQKPS